MPIHPVEDGMPVEADNVYLIPPRKEMIISDGRLLLSERERQQELTLPIDVFFRSLARDCGPRAVAIVLSGGGTDGSRGIRDVHDAGGLVIVQDLASAQFDGMPKTASEVGVAQWVLPPEEMPRALVEHTAARLVPAANGAGAPEEIKGIGAVYRMLQDEFGIDFTHYKPSTVTRRIERRLALAQSSNIDEYVQRLREDRDELDVLYRDLLIGVTRFFRDREAFRILEERVLPALLRQEPRNRPLRFWVAGCATGEEVYTLAIVLRDLMEKIGERPIQIFATDVHRGSIKRASRGIYEADAVVNVSKERRARYFVRMGDAYQVAADLRQMVVFAHHNVIKNAPFTRVDFITCRNLLIYLQPAAQQKVLSLFHFALKRGGVLLLGPSETVGIIARDFEVIDKHWRLYRKHTDARMPVDNPVAPLATVDLRPAFPAIAASTHHHNTPSRYSLAQLLGTYDAVLEEVMPPSLLVTDRGELVHAFGGASRFLRMRDGRQDLDILDVVDSDLRMVLVGGLKRALNEPAPIVFKGVRIDNPHQQDQSGRYNVDHPELVEDLKRVLASGEPVERELQGVRGRAFFLRILAYRAKGNIEGVVLTLIDVSGLKAAEDALFHERYLLNSLLATVPDAIYFKDAAGRIIRANMVMAKRLGLKSPDEAEGKTAFELADARVALALHQQDEEVLRTGDAQDYSLEKRSSPEGREEWDLVTRLPLRDAQGGIVGIIVIFRNVTEQRNAEEDIREAVRRRDQFLAMLSHELRNPLGAIVTATTLLKVDGTSAGGPAGLSQVPGSEQGIAQRRRERFLAILERQAQQMTRLLDDLLEASRVTQNKVELRKQVLDLNAVVKDAVDAVRGQIDAQGVTLQAELAPGPLTVDGDPARLQQIVVNLLSNAVKYTPRGGHVSIKVDRDQEQAVVRLKDNGAGIPPDMLESIFDLFVQSRRTLDRAAGGLGVGLTLVRSLARMHGGTVSAHSKGEGQGSEFVLRLPLVAPAPVARGRHVPVRDLVAGENQACALPDGAMVVVVEDNRDSREMLCELLQLSGFKCRTADTGPAALALIEELRPDIAILDVGLPEMDGFELARRIRRTQGRGDICLIALTGYGQPSDHALGIEAGFDAHLVKPVQAEQLLALMTNLRRAPASRAAAQS